MVQFTSRFVLLVALVIAATAPLQAQAAAIGARRESATPLEQHHALPGKARADRASSLSTAAPKLPYPLVVQAKRYASSSQDRTISSRIMGRRRQAASRGAQKQDSHTHDTRFFASRVLGRRRPVVMPSPPCDHPGHKKRHYEGTDSDVAEDGDLEARGVEAGTLIGNKYVVEPERVVVPTVPKMKAKAKARAKAKNTKHTSSRRADIGPARIPGQIDIMSPVAGSGEGVRLASLLLVPGDNGTYFLDASQHNHTSLFLVVAPPAPGLTAPLSGVEDPSDVPVLMEVDVLDAPDARVATWCATYDPNPDGPSALHLEECVPLEVAGRVPHKSQTFLWNKLTSAVRPLFYVGADDSGSLSSKSTGEGHPSNSTASTSPATTGNPSSANSGTSSGISNSGPAGAGGNAPSNGTSSSSISAEAVSAYQATDKEKVGGAKKGAYDDTSSRPPPALAVREPAPEPAPQNVTMVFRPEVPVAHAAATGSSDMPSSTASSSVAPSSTGVIGAAEAAPTPSATTSAATSSSSVAPSVSSPTPSSSFDPAASVAGVFNVASDTGVPCASTGSTDSAAPSATASVSGALKAADAEATTSVLPVTTSASSPSARSLSASATGTMNVMAVHSSSADPAASTHSSSTMTLTSSTTVTSTATYMSMPSSTASGSTSDPAAAMDFKAADASTGTLATGGATASASGSTRTAAPTAGVLGIELLDGSSGVKSATTATASAPGPSASATGMVHEKNVASPVADPSVATSAAPSMKPGSTAPYMWKFRRELD